MYALQGDTLQCVGETLAVFPAHLSKQASIEELVFSIHRGKNERMSGSIVIDKRTSTNQSHVIAELC